MKINLEFTSLQELREWVTSQVSGPVITPKPIDDGSKGPDLYVVKLKYAEMFYSLQEREEIKAALQRLFKLTMSESTRILAKAPTEVVHTLRLIWATHVMHELERVGAECEMTTHSVE